MKPTGVAQTHIGNRIRCPGARKPFAWPGTLRKQAQPSGPHPLGEIHRKAPGGSLSLRVVLLQGTVAHEEISSADPSHPLSEGQLKALLDSESAGLKWRKRDSVFRTDNSGNSYGTESWSRSDGAIAKFWVTGKAGSQDLSGQMELSSKRFADAQAYFDKQDEAN